VVHTDYLLTQLEAHGIRNGKCIYYPMFDRISDKTTEAAKAYVGTSDCPTVLGVVGATSSYKGLDLLIDALNGVRYPCTLFVAGTASAFGADYIADHLTNPLVGQNLHLRRLSDEEFADAIRASDVIVLPYRKEFDGASGPLVSAAVHDKPVIAADHGSLGDIVTRYRLGLCFESENAARLTETLNTYLAAPAAHPFDTEAFCQQLTVDAFLRAYRDVYAMD
jgi:glycosyltransferase involved in cell wall biosynthesis